MLAVPVMLNPNWLLLMPKLLSVVRIVGFQSNAGRPAKVLLQPVARWSDRSVANAHVLAPVPELVGTTRLASANEGSWSDTGSALPVYGGTNGSLVAVASLGRGRIILLADASILQNR